MRAKKVKHVITVSNPRESEWRWSGSRNFTPEEQDIIRRVSRENPGFSVRFAPEKILDHAAGIIDLNQLIK